MPTSFAGAGTALVTPFRADGSLDEAAFRRLVRRQIEGSIDVLVRKCAPKTQRVVSILADSVVLVTLVLLIIYGIQLTIKGQTKLTPILGIPYSYVDASIPVSCSFMLMYYGRMFWNSLRGKQNTTALDEDSEESPQ